MKALIIYALLSCISIVWGSNEIVARGLVIQGTFEVTDDYPGGFTARIVFPATRHYPFGWLLNVTFDMEVLGFEVYEGEVIGVHPSNRYMIVKHNPHNKNLHRDASYQKVFYCKGACDLTPVADIRFIPIRNADETFEQALIRAEDSGVTGDNPPPIVPIITTTTISFLSHWTPPVFEALTSSSTAQPTTSITTTPTTPPLNLAALNLRYNLRDVVTKSLLFIEAQRSGALPESNRISWRSHSALSDGSDHGLDLNGGYYIDGGFVKYGYPMAFATTLMAWGVLEFREAYLASTQIPHVMNALKWSTDYFLKCHVSPLTFYGQISTFSIDGAYWGRPEDFRANRPSFKIDRLNPGSDLAAEVAASLAATSMIFQNQNATYSSLLITHAEQLYQFATRYPGKYSDSIKEASPAYTSKNGFHDELAWAALWLYKATGRSLYLNEAKDHLKANPDETEMTSFYWDDKRAGAILLLAQITSERVYKDKVRSFCDSLQHGRRTLYTPRGLVFISETGATGMAAGVGVVCLLAANLGINTDIYRQFAHGQLSYILGDGGRSYMVGFGEKPPTQPYHRASSCPDLPAPCTWADKASNASNPQELTGAVVSGPNRWDAFTDDRQNYVGSSVALDHNAALQTLAAGILKLQVTGETFSEPNPEELNSAVSETFSVRHDYGEVMRLSLLFYEAQRAGELPNNNRVPWRQSAFVNDADGIDLSGGYFDSGDYVKFNFPMAFSTTALAWGLIQYSDAYKHVGERDNCMRALKWATDYFIKCHVGKKTFYGQVGSWKLDHAHWSTPDAMRFVSRPIFNLTESRPGSELVAEVAAALAATAIVFNASEPEYAQTLIHHAEELHEFAKSNKEKYHRSIPDASRFYRSISGFNDELVWSSLWLFSATGERKYLSYAQRSYHRFRLSNSSPRSFFWDDKTAGVQLLLAQITRQETYHEAVRGFCDRFLPENGYRHTPRGLVFIDRRGPLRHASGVAFICLGAANLEIRPQRYRDFAKRQLHYMLGDSGMGSLVVGYGPSPPTRPWHRTSACPSPPEPCGMDYLRSNDRNPHVLSGALVGGPNINDQFNDDRTNQISNRVALDYNAAFQSAIAALKYLELYPPIVPTTPQPTQTSAGNFSDETTESLELEIDLEIWFGGDDYLDDKDGAVETIPTTQAPTTTPGLVGNIVNQPQEPDEVTEPVTTVAAETTSIVVTTQQPTTTTLVTTRPTTQTTLAKTTLSETTTPFENSTSNGTLLVTNQTIDETTQATNVTNTTLQLNMTTPVTNITAAKRVIIRISPLKARLSYLEEIVYVSECRPSDVFDICAVHRHLFHRHTASETFHCRYDAFKACSEKQGAACAGQIWSHFPFWNDNADDVAYFTDEEMRCRDPSIDAVENCEVSGITRTLTSCYSDSANQVATDNHVSLCRWKIFRQCVDYKVGRCPHTWDIVTLWNSELQQPRFNQTEIKCGNTASSQLKTSCFVLTLCLLFAWMLTVRVGC